MNVQVAALIVELRIKTDRCRRHTWDVQNAVSKLGAPAASDLGRAMLNVVSLGVLGTVLAWRVDERDRTRARGVEGFATQLDRTYRELTEAMVRGNAALERPPTGMSAGQARDLGAVLEDARQKSAVAATTLDWWNASEEAILLRSNPLLTAAFGRRAERAMEFISESAAGPTGAGRLTSPRDDPRDEGTEEPPNYMPYVGLAVGVVGGIGGIWLLRKVGI